MASSLPRPPISEVAFIGLGAMGYPMAANLKKLSNCNVLVWDRTTTKSRQHALEFNTRFASSIEELRSCSLVFLCLPTSSEVELICSQLGPTLPPGAIVADCTSGNPHVTRRIASSLARCHVEMVDCPVSGGPAGAMSGQLASMIGGSDDAVNRVEPFLKHMAQKQVVRVGGIGAGHAVKAVNNTLNTGHLVMAAEGLLALAKFGIDPVVAVEAINGSSGRSLQTEVRIPKNVLTRDFDYGFPLRLMLKDVTTASDSIYQDLIRSNIAHDNDNDQFPRFFPLVKDLLQKAVELESEDADYTKVIRPLEAESGLELHGAANSTDSAREVGGRAEYIAPSYLPTKQM